MTLWTTNTWGAAHQNAAVFMRNLGPLVRALRRVRRRKRKAVVTHTVYEATAEDGAAQPQDRAPPPLPSPLTHLSLPQGQCSTKFLSPPPFLCLSGPDCVHVATWGLSPWFDHSQHPLPLRLRGTQRRVDRDPGILICCYSILGCPSPCGFSRPTLILLLPTGPGILVRLFPLFPLPNCLSWIQLSLPLYSVLESQTLRLGFQQPSFHCQGPSQMPADLAQLCLLTLA